mmetsp:Transcript_8423/g.18165  ORF Transcript_8423/g.18165 Transcript_8423/m.18165 type:complete len:347 (+) Transcript_8423:90-1130(+)
MTTFLVALGALCLTLRFGIMLIFAGRAIGFPTTMLLAPRVCEYCFGGRQPFRRTAGVVARRMTAIGSSNTANAESLVIQDGTSGRSDLLLSSLPVDLKTWFDISLPEGRCIGVVTVNETECFPQNPPDTVEAVKSDHWIHSIFHIDEIDFGMNLNKTRNSYWLGRLAMRIALDFPDYPILRDQYGRPQLGPNIFGSISHKRNKGVAIVSSSMIDSGNPDIILSGVGIDLEMTSRPGRPNIAKRILTKTEQKSLGNIPGISIDDEVLLRFSLKEAIYKAAHPLLRQYVGFKEAEVTPFPDGTASCLWLLENKVDRRIAKLTAHWRKLDDRNYFLTSASVYTKADLED